MTTTKISAGAKFPELTVRALDGSAISLGKPGSGADWQLVLVYRGKHCPICTKYLNNIEGYKDRLAEAGIELVGVSADRKEQLEEHLQKIDVSFPLYYGLSMAQMKALGLYISEPMSAKETDHPFAEPALFVIDGEGKVRVAELCNNPFVRPDPETLVSGLEWIRKPDNDYPIRGTLAA